jgi:hypothetical protein
MAIEATAKWYYESQRQQYVATTLTLRRLDPHVIEIRLEGKDGSHFSVLLGSKDSQDLRDKLCTVLDLEEG